MKKLLFIVALLVSSGSLFAQCVGGLTIDNSNGKCGVWVKLLAMDPFSGDPVTCQLNSFTFLVPQATTWTWNSVYDFQGFPAACMCGTAGTPSLPPVVNWAFGSPILCGTPSFQWTDVTFQWDRCGDCNAGGNLSNACSPNCWGAGIFFSYTVPCTHTAAWQPTGGGCVLPNGNLLLVFS